MSWYLIALKKYATFSGRARRKEYWMFWLFNMIITLGFGLLGSLVSEFVGRRWLGLGIFILYIIGTFIPQLAVSVRRLHDQDRSGWWLLLQAVPYVGFIFWLVLMTGNGTQGENQYGPDPKEYPV